MKMSSMEDLEAFMEFFEHMAAELEWGESRELWHGKSRLRLWTWAGHELNWESCHVSSSPLCDIAHGQLIHKFLPPNKKTNKKTPTISRGSSYLGSRNTVFKADKLFRLGSPMVTRISGQRRTQLAGTAWIAAKKIATEAGIHLAQIQCHQREPDCLWT